MSDVKISLKKAWLSFVISATAQFLLIINSINITDGYLVFILPVIIAGVTGLLNYLKHLNDPKEPLIPVDYSFGVAGLHI